MNFNTKILSTAAFTASVALGMAGGVTAAYAQPPQLTIQTEQRAHPELVTAIRDLEAALRHLKESPDDFGGHKERAIQACVGAIHNLKGALYYRLKLDDAALDRAE